MLNMNNYFLTKCGPLLSKKFRDVMLNLNINTFNLIIFLFLAILGAYWVSLPLYYQSCGFSLFQIGILISVENLAGFFGQFFWARISDLLGKRKPFLIMSSICWMVTLFIYTYICTFHMFLILVLSKSLLTPPMMPLLTTLVLTQNSHKLKAFTFAHYRIWGSIGWVISTFFTGSIIANFGLKYVFYLNALISLLLIFITAQIKEFKIFRPEKQEKAFFKIKRQFVLFLSIILIFQLTHYMIIPFMPVYLKKIGASPQLISISSSLSAILEVPIMLWIGKLTNRKGKKLLLIFGLTIAALRYFLYSIIMNPLLLLPIHLLQAITYSIVEVITVVSISDVFPMEQQAIGQTLYYSSSSIAGIIGPYLGGLVADTYGITSTFHLALGITVICTLFINFIKI